jgi:hypothetical protein
VASFFRHHHHRHSCICSFMDEMKNIWMNGCRFVFFFFFSGFCHGLQWSHIVNRQKQHISVSHFSIENVIIIIIIIIMKKTKLKNRNQCNKNIWCIYSLTITALIKRRKNKEFFSS